MRKVLFMLIGLFISVILNAQAYRGLNIGPEPTRVTINSSSGISVVSVQYQNGGSYSVCMMNNNYNNPDERNIYSFKWYLSYKGSRVSDYYNSSLKCREQVTFNQITVWPGTVPSGYEKYVTVQFFSETPNTGRSNSNYTPTSKRIRLGAVSNIRVANTTGRNCKYFDLFDDGKVQYAETGSDGWNKLEREGTYVIDTNNIIHITWSNGFEETATLSYQSSRRGVIQYNGYTLLELLDTD